MPEFPSSAALRLRVYEDVEDDRWDRLCALDPRAHCFQRSTWLRLLERVCPSLALRWWIVESDVGRWEAGLPVILGRRWGLRRLASGVSGTYGGPVARPGAHEAEALLLRRFAHGGGFGVVSRELVWAGESPPAGAADLLEPLPTTVVEVPRPFERFLMDVLPKNRRNECNRSERRGLRVELDNDPELLERFVPLYQEQSRAWGVRPEPPELLHGALDQMAEIRLFVARLGDQLMGAHLCFEMSGELFAWLGTTRRSNEVFPSALLIREEARFCHDHALPRLNLGTSLGLSGVENYKKLLGGRDAPRWILRRGFARRSAPQSGRRR